MVDARLELEADCLDVQQVLDNLVGLVLLPHLQKVVRLQNLVAAELILVVHQDLQVREVGSLRRLAAFAWFRFVLCGDILSGGFLGQAVTGYGLVGLP